MRKNAIASHQYMAMPQVSVYLEGGERTISPTLSCRASWFRNWLENSEQVADPSLWYLAMDGDQAVGLALCGVYDNEDRQLGHVNSLGVLRSHRRQGIGQALLRHAFSEYYRRGYKGVTLGVDAENLTGALRLYKKVGMSVHRQFDLYEKELRPGKEISVNALAD